MENLPSTISAELSGTAVFEDGTISIPAIRFADDEKSGIYRSGGSSIIISNNATDIMSIGETKTTLNTLLCMSGISSVPVAITNKGYLYKKTSDDNLYWKTLGGGETAIPLNSGVTWPILAPTSAVSAPSYSFSGNTNTGIYSSGADTLDFATNGANRLKIADALITSTVGLTISAGNLTASSSTVRGSKFIGGNGTAGAPSFTFAPDITSGIYYDVGTSYVGIVQGTTNVMQLNTSDVTLYSPIIMSNLDITQTGNISTAVNNTYSIGSSSFKYANIYMTNAVINGTTITNTEVDKITSITNGTAAASKALVLDSSRNITNIATLTTDTIKLLTSGGTQSSLNYYEEGSGTLNWSGAFTSNNVTYYFTRIGKNVTLTFTQVLATSGAVTAAYLTSTALPSRLRPPVSIFSNTLGSNNSAGALVSVVVQADGVCIIGNGNSVLSNFTAEGATTGCGAYAWTISYAMT